MVFKREKNEVENISQSTYTGRIAMLDVDRIVAKSLLVKKLKIEHDKKNKEIERWLRNVKKQLYGRANKILYITRSTDT